MMDSKSRLLIYTEPESPEVIDQSILIAAGYEVTVVSRLQAFETWLSSSLPDTLLILVHPSASQGLKYAQTLLQAHPLLPIILVSDEIDQSLLKQGLTIGLRDYLTAPLDPATLLQSVASSLERHKAVTAESQFAWVLDNLVDGFFLADMEGNLVLFNQSARKIFQLTQPPDLKIPVAEMIKHPDLLNIFKPQTTQPCRCEISLEDGRVFSAQSTKIPGVGIAVVLQEISHLKELDRIKTDFVNTVSHDLRSPLTSIYGFIGLIDRVGPVNQQQAEFIHHIQSSLQHITSLINDLLDLGQMEAGYDLEMGDVNLAIIIQQAVENLEYQVNNKMQRVELSISPETPVVRGNFLHLQRMITNLVENAVKFTPPMGTIGVRGHVEANELIIEVSDNGPGIPLADQPFIFDRFYRGSNLVHETSGTGLGLSIVKAIVEKHHGRIWVDSSPKGTTFTVILPVK